MDIMGYIGRDVSHRRKDLSTHRSLESVNVVTEGLHSDCSLSVPFMFERYLFTSRHSSYCNYSKVCAKFYGLG